MPDYLVRYNVEVTADTHEQAAIEACAALRDRDQWPVGFEVIPLYIRRDGRVAHSILTTKNITVDAKQVMPLID